MTSRFGRINSNIIKDVIRLKIEIAKSLFHLYAVACTLDGYTAEDENVPILWIIYVL
ncbi:11666_t:CDS:2 [Funneliformis geosporum]|uniref:11666_t:CDS:1 n=1 Tax=Funneliformis geosporum TaxID=1117311 RepID=A0A9W4WZS6_9GLOM|nr:11666_t:CDS:2 [Funneliformis geosporum]